MLELLIKIKELRAAQILFQKLPTKVNQMVAIKREMEIDTMLFMAYDSILEEMEKQAEEKWRENEE